MSPISNPFAVLLDTESILSACARSRALEALPRSARVTADRPSPARAQELLAFDATIDALFNDTLARSDAKAARASAKPASAKNAAAKAVAAEPVAQRELSPVA